eukprot:Skav226776  [mRNA]  locus=scaffold8:240062:243845:+ [translate_table: standard]
MAKGFCSKDGLLLTIDRPVPPSGTEKYSRQRQFISSLPCAQTFQELFHLVFREGETVASALAKLFARSAKPRQNAAASGAGVLAKAWHSVRRSAVGGT